ncbi:hypothetical protein [Melghirimyces profundicolus]|uniref:hypothetical protein n=1 Tax=Melghirimyces profundicolus TaxID=1242148 RepID=UPI000D3B9A30|nr:hypothetical protein [Melghirimyces profundicolus]
MIQWRYFMNPYKATTNDEEMSRKNPFHHMVTPMVPYLKSIQNPSGDFDGGIKTVFKCQNLKACIQEGLD